MRRLLIVLFAVLVACSDGAAPEDPSTTAIPTTRALSETSMTSTTEQPAVATSAAPATPGRALVEQTCEMLASERAAGREAALEDFYRANPETVFVDWLGPVYSDCEQQFANHAAAQSIYARTADISSVGYSGLSGCTESPATAELRNRNGFNMAVLAIVVGESDGPDWGWGYHYEPNLPASTDLPIEIPWSVPRPGVNCGLYTRAWVADDSAATATLHAMGDSPEADLPVGAPPLHTQGEDVAEIVQSLLDFEFWLYRNPDPDFVEEITDVRDADYAAFEEFIAELAANQSWWEASAEFISARVVEELDENTWLVEYETGPGRFSFHDDGEVSRESAYEWRKRLIVIHRSTYDGRWRWLTPSMTIGEL